MLRQICLIAIVFLAPSAALAEGDSFPPLRDLQGERIDPTASPWTVYCFLGTECPLAKLYAPRLQRLAEQFQPAGVRFVGVNSNVQDSPAEVEKYAREHGIRFPNVKDSDQSIMRYLGASRTPEVVVASNRGDVVYRGRIDDQYTPGTARQEPTTHDLKNALAALIIGAKVAQPVTTAVGCVITPLPDRNGVSPLEEEITFARDVAPILNRRCVECHRAGEIGPFALEDYDEVVGWGHMILEVIEEGRMPPWHAAAGHRELIGGREMPEHEVAVLKKWVDQGMPSGNLDSAPEPPSWPGGWHLTTAPDEVLAMRDRPFRVPAEGTVEYQYFVVDPGWETDRWVRAAQVIPGNPSVVHHTIVFVRPPDGEYFGGIGWVGGYVPGQRAIALPPGHARRIPAGSKLVFQMHYTPNGTTTDDVTQVGIWFADEENVTDEVLTFIGIEQQFEIPPGAADHTVRVSLDAFPEHSRLLSVMPHMHLRGKSFQLRSDSAGEREVLVEVPRYDFNWQHWYTFAEPLALDGVDALEMTFGFDNSRSNPVNPDPKAFVGWGDQTWEEMAVAFLGVARPRQREESEEPAWQPRTAAPEIIRKAKQRTDAFFAKLDRNGDGFILPEETPPAFERFGFGRFDEDRDRRLRREEIQRAFEFRLLYLK